MVMACGLINTPATIQREIYRILKLLQGMELVINTKSETNKDKGKVAAAYIKDILISTK